MNERLKRVGVTKQSLLHRLEEERIFSVKVTDAGAIFTEECDAYFTHEMTKDEVRQLVRELLDLIGDQE